MRRIDVLFFGLIFVCLGIVLLSITFEFKLPSVFQFWWCVYLPYVFLMLFYPKCRIANWFNENI